MKAKQGIFPVRRSSWMRAIPVCLLCAACFVSVAEADEQSKKSFIVQPVKDQINVRNDASVQSASIIAVDRSDYIEVVGEKYDWYKIILPARLTGYISGVYVESTGKSEGTITASSVNIRLEPSTQGLVIGSVKRGEKVIIRGKENDWYSIQAYPYGRGWVYQSLVRKVSAETPVPAVMVPQRKDDPSPVRQNASDPQKALDTSLPLFQKETVYEGVLKKNKRNARCSAPYTLSLRKGTIFLRSSQALERYQNKKVRIGGTYVLEKDCVFLDVQTIFSSR